MHQHQSLPENDFLAFEALLTQTEGPSLEDFSHLCAIDFPVSALESIQFIRRLLQSKIKEVRYIGMEPDSLANAFSYALLLLGRQQSNYYPHLNSLVKEQFYRADIFIDYSAQQRAQIARACEDCLQDSSEQEDFAENNIIMLSACQTILKAILRIRSGVSSTDSTMEYLSRRFNIDLERVPFSSAACQIWKLGKEAAVHIIRDAGHYLVVASGSGVISQAEPRCESEREMEDLHSQAIIEASQESTPKFKQNQESIRYRRKSHKNSFGGDFQIGNYKELAGLVNNKNAHRKNKKVFSERFATQDMGELEQLQTEVNNQDIGIDQTAFLMRSSQIQDPISPIPLKRQKQLANSQILRFPNKLSESDSPTPDSSDFKVSFSKKDRAKFLMPEDDEDVIELDSSKQIMPKIPEQVQSSQQTDKKTERQSSYQNEGEGQRREEQIQGDGRINLSKKDRKFSFLTQPFISSRREVGKELKKSYQDITIHEKRSKTKQIKSPKRYKNSEAITEGPMKRKFEENPISFSQLIQNQYSHFSGSPSDQNIRKNSNLFQLNSSVFEFHRDKAECEPSNWVRKEVVYYFQDKAPETRIFQRTYSHSEIGGASPNKLKIVTHPTLINARSTMDSFQPPFNLHKNEGFAQYNRYRGNNPSETSIENKARSKVPSSHSSGMRPSLQPQNQLYSDRDVRPTLSSPFHQRIEVATSSPFFGRYLSSPSNKPRVSFNYISSPQASQPPLRRAPMPLHVFRRP